MPTIPRCAIGAGIRARPHSTSGTVSRRPGSTSFRSARAVRYSRALTALSAKSSADGKSPESDVYKAAPPSTSPAAAIRSTRTMAAWCSTISPPVSCRVKWRSTSLTARSICERNCRRYRLLHYPQALIQKHARGGGESAVRSTPSAPYIGQCNSAGQVCDQVFLWGPWLSKWDVSLVKRTQIKERLNFEFRVQALNVFNHPNILISRRQCFTGGGGLGQLQHQHHYQLVLRTDRPVPSATLTTPTIRAPEAWSLWRG